MQEKRIKVLDISNTPEVGNDGYEPAMWRRLLLGEKRREPTVNYSLTLQLELPDKCIRPGHIIAIPVLKVPGVSLKDFMLKDMEKILARCMMVVDPGHKDGYTHRTNRGNTTIGYFLKIDRSVDMYKISQFAPWLDIHNKPVYSMYAEDSNRKRYRGDDTPLFKTNIYHCRYEDPLVFDKKDHSIWSADWLYRIEFRSTVKIEEKDIIQYGPLKFRVYYLSSSSNHMPAEPGFTHYKAESIETTHDRITVRDFIGHHPQVIHKGAITTPRSIYPSRNE